MASRADNRVMPAKVPDTSQEDQSWLAQHKQHVMKFFRDRPMREGFTTAAQRLEDIFEGLNPQQWNYSARAAANVVAATIIHAYDSTPLVAPPSYHETSSRDGASAHPTAKPHRHAQIPPEGQSTNAGATAQMRLALTSPASEQVQQNTFSVTVRPALKSAPLPPVTTSTTTMATRAVASTYTPTPRQLKQVCAYHLSNRRCKQGKQCPASLHICRRYWFGIKNKGDTAAYRHGGDGVSHWDRELNTEVIHLRPSCAFELPDSEGKVKGCRGSCSRAHPVDSGHDGWMVRLRQYWRGGRR